MKKSSTGKKKRPQPETTWYAYKPKTMTHLIVFFGGFFDGTFKPVLSAVEHYVANQRFGPTTGVLYFSWSDAAWWSYFARKKILEVAPGTNLRGVGIVGHSYGAHSARKVADQMNLAVDALVTVDGVSWESALFWFSKPNSVKKWINVYENWIGDFSDFVACVGGHWGSESGADVNLYVPHVTHAEFHEMFVKAESQFRSAMGLTAR